MTSVTESFQVSTEAAEVYEEKFVPALFGEWAARLIDAAEVAPGDAVIDVACGTGVVARAVADQFEGRGKIVGVDLNRGMLAVARRIRPDVEWREADATALPFPDASFDTALCQAALMYVPDKVGALSEMARVVRDGGVVAVQVWGELRRQPGYRAFADVLARHAGPEAIDLVGSYFSLGDINLVTDLFEKAGLEVTSVKTEIGTVRFDSLNEFVAAEVEGSPLSERIGAETYAQIVEESRDVLGRFCGSDGRVRIPIEGHVVTGRKGPGYREVD